MKPLWEILHDGWIEDIKFDLKEINEYSELLKKHIHDPMGDNFRDIIKNIDKHLEKTCKEYKKIYGRRPDMRRLRNET